jgi:hypothetical protein
LLEEWSPAFEIATTESVNAGDILGPTVLTGKLRIWVVVGSKSHARLYFAAAEGERFYVRDVALTAGLDETGRETLVQIIVATANAFKSEAMLSSVAEVEASFRENSSNVAVNIVNPISPANATTVGRVNVSGSLKLGETQSWQPDFGIFYQTTAVSTDTVGHGPGLALGLLGPSRGFDWRFSLQAQYRFPLDVEKPDCTLTLRSSFWSVGVGPEWKLAKTKRVGFTLATGVERTRFELTVPLASSVEPRSSRVHYRPFVDVETRLGLMLGELYAIALLGVQTSLLRTHYDVSETPMFIPWRIAPHVGVELNWR